MKNLLPILFITLLVGILAMVNYQPGTYLTGWDNLHPEFDFGLNIKRSIFAAWQEYQGTGLLGGMGHASDLVHQLILFVLSAIIPNNQLRYVWTMLTMLVGTTGAFILIRYILNQKNESRIKNQEELTRHSGEVASRDRLQNRFWTSQNDMIALLGSLFYLLNLSTIQAYFAPFEVFTVHFAAIPWLFLTAIKFLHAPSKTNLALATLVLILSTPQGYVPTLFVVYATSVCIFIAANRLFKRGLVLMAVIFITNAFWLLPFAYFTATNSSANLNAKINQEATETIVLKNKEFGTIADVAMLKGFWFNNVEPDREGNFRYMFEPLRAYTKQPAIQTIGYTLFIIVLLGVLASLKSKNRILIAFATVFLCAITMLLTDTIPFSFLDDFVRDHVPLFSQAFRFPFTKFSVLASLMYAIFFAVGISSIANFINKRIANYESRIENLVSYSCFIILASCLLIQVFPIFQGHLFYGRERIAIPKEYFDTFAFFKKQDPNTRIGNFPQASFWSWNYYKWGYSGSGFLWYGIHQPILDRAFDVWSKYSENYYFEISQALHSQNPQLFEAVLDKYQMNWLLVDKNVVYPASPKAVFYDELELLLAKIPRIKQAARFGNIVIYAVDLKTTSKDFVFVGDNFRKTNNYATNAIDTAYQQYQTYTAVKESDLTDPGASSYSYYPFVSLSSLKNEGQKDFTLLEDQNEITLSQTLAAPLVGTLFVPSLTEDPIVATDVRVEQNRDLVKLFLVVKPTKVFLSQRLLFGQEKEIELFTVALKELGEKTTLTINGVASYTLPPEPKTLGTTFLLLQEDNVITLGTVRGVQTVVIKPSQLAQLGLLNNTYVGISAQAGEVLSAEIPKITDTYQSYTTRAGGHTGDIKSCDPFRKDVSRFSPYTDSARQGILLSSKNATLCFALYIPTLSHKQAYAIRIANKHIQGQGIHFWIENNDQRYVPLDSYLPQERKWNESFFILPPQEPFGSSYSLHLDNIAIGSQTTENVIESIALYPLPYRFLKGIEISQSVSQEKSSSNPAKHVSHPHEGLYAIELDPKTLQNATLVLSQGYDDGWKAYRIQNSLNVLLPFIMGTELKNHVLVNNWENGWQIGNWKLEIGNSTLILVYLPQYLEYIGLIIILFYLAYIGISVIHEKFYKFD